jgi:hypothetical protein
VVITLYLTRDLCFPFQIQAHADLGARNEVAVDGAMVDNSTAELGRLGIGVREDDTGWVVGTRGLGSLVQRLAVRHQRVLIPRTSGTLISSR